MKQIKMLPIVLLNLDPLAGGAVEVDPLAVAADSVDTSMPLLAPDKLYNMTVAKVDQKTNEKGVSMLKITLKTTKDEQDSQGNVINTGFPVFENFVYTPTGELTIEQIKKSGALILKALGMGGSTVRDLVNNPQQIVDKVVCVKIKTRKESGGFPASSQVGSWVALKA